MLCFVRINRNAQHQEVKKWESKVKCNREKKIVTSFEDLHTFRRSSNYEKWKITSFAICHNFERLCSILSRGSMGSV